MKANVRKYMCILVVKGTYRKHIFAKKRAFEIYFYYTPIKKITIDYNCDGISLDRLGILQVIGIPATDLDQQLKKLGYETYHIER